MAKRIEFTKDYDHQWESRAMTSFKAGTVETVKDEVAEQAIERGCAKLAKVTGGK